MDKERLMPALNIGFHLDADTGEVKPAKYMTGHPRQYRFDAGKGIVNINGEEPLTKPGKEFKFIPLAARVFKSNLFERGRNTWAELFFLNCSNQLCVIMLHGYSVENLERLQSELFYDDLMLNEVILTMTPQQKTSKTSENTFYIAEFEYSAAPSDLLDSQKAAIEGLQIYRQDTVKDDETMILNLNYHELPKLNAPDESTEDVAALPSAAG